MTETIERVDDRAGDVRSVSSWVALCRWAGFAVGVWAVALQLMAGQFIPPITAIGVVLVGVAVFLTGERRRLAAVFAGLALVALLGNLPGTIDELSNPTSAPAFILTLLVSLAALVGVVGGIAAFFRWPTDSVRAVAITAGALFALGAIVSFVAAAGVDSDVPLASDVEVRAEGIEFVPENITVASGDVGVWVDNKDGIRHTFSITELGVDLAIPGLKAQRVDFEAAPGEYTIFCTVPGHEDMTAMLIVEG